MIKVLYSIETRVLLRQLLPRLLLLFLLLVILYISLLFLLFLMISSFYLANVLQEFVYSGMDISSVSCILAGVGGPTRM